MTRDDAVAEVARLKAQPGKDLSVGGPTLAANFLQAGLIDEYRLFVQPAALGSGMPMFPIPDYTASLRLVETRRFESGVVSLSYRSAGEDTR